MKIALVSDTHLTPRVAAFGANWAAVRAWIESTRPDLVVNLGDITADGAEHPEELDVACPAFAGLAPEVRFVPGNHDIGDNPLEPGRPTDHPLDLERLAHYRRLFGPDWWSLDCGSWQIVALNAQLFAPPAPTRRPSSSPGWRSACASGAAPWACCCTSRCSATVRTTPRCTSATCLSCRGADS